MPIYEYKCKKCGYRFAMLEPLGTPQGGRECPTCGTKETTRMLSSFSAKTEPGGRSDCKPGGG